jgi:eukaryotic-like serine/threonine-protein kinase
MVIGESVGPYQVLALLGLGGMGEVYRARDSKLNRDVALKILPAEFALDADRLSRFKREAQVLASLNHPNIAAIYGFEESGSVQALVLELVEGETLAERLGRGRQEGLKGQDGRESGKRLPVDEALPIARQIAEALEAAHELGIVHRDLKPANIKLRPDGTVKVLDFGLAKMLEAGGAGAAGGNVAQGFSPANGTNSPTIMSPAVTGTGLILGTAAYMSPEQAKGRSADKRSDVWAFGCVLYEMLTGTRAFEGEDVSDTLAFVLTKQPDWDALPPPVPPSIRKLLHRCLEKDRKRRLADLGDARLEIDDALQMPTDATTLDGHASRRERLPWLLAALSGVVAVGAIGYVVAEHGARAPTDAPVIRFSLSPPEGTTLVALGLGASLGPLAVSPDGRRFAMVARNAEGKVRLWIRSLDELAARELAGTDGAIGPFWSPDGRFLGFSADGKVKKLDISGGPPVSLCDAAGYVGGAWSRDGTILFGRQLVGLYKVPSSGGTPVAVTTLGKGERGHVRPTFLPDGRHFFYSDSGGSGTYIGSLDSPARTTLLENPDAITVAYSQGHLLFLRGTTLMAHAFDQRRLTLSGEAVPIADQIQTGGQPPFTRFGLFAASENGLLVYQTGTSLAGGRLVWLDRFGKQVGTLGQRGTYSDVELSPDGKRAAVSLFNLEQRAGDIWVFDVDRSVPARLTFDPTDDHTPIWSPDGNRLAFVSQKGDAFSIYQKAANGTGSTDLLLADNREKYVFNWAADGRDQFIVFITGTRQDADVSVLPLSADRKPVSYLHGLSAGPGNLSHDGRWFTYQSVESGQTDVYVAPFPSASEKVRISGAGGAQPRWSRDGKELFYLAPSEQRGPLATLMAVPVNGNGPDFRVGTPQALFAFRPAGTRYVYDVSADGQRFLVNRQAEDEAATPSPITVVVNWAAALKE